MHCAIAVVLCRVTSNPNYDCHQRYTIVVHFYSDYMLFPIDATFTIARYCYRCRLPKLPPPLTAFSIGDLRHVFFLLFTEWSIRLTIWMPDLSCFLLFSQSLPFYKFTHAFALLFVNMFADILLFYTSSCYSTVVVQHIS